MDSVIPSKFGPEVLLIFIGHSSDADKEAQAIRELERELQRELERLRAVTNGTLPFKTVRCWEWNFDAPTRVGGQSAIITPELDRANIALFVFKERVGKVTWNELERSRTRSAQPIPVAAFFPASSPKSRRMFQVPVVEAWLELLQKKLSLAADWTAPDSKSLKPVIDYRDTDHLKTIVLEQMKDAFGLVLGSIPPKVIEIRPAAIPVTFLGEHPDLSYDRRPVLAHSVEELDENSVKAFLERPLSREQLQKLGCRVEDRNTNIPTKLKALGCLCDGRPTLGTFVCFAPAILLADKFDGCRLQMVVYDRVSRGASSPSITSTCGNLLQLYEEGMSWLTKGAVLRRRGRVGTVERDELEIPEIVFHEVLANALVHREYEAPQLREQPTRLEVFPDRVEIISYGNLLAGVPLDSLNSDAEGMVPWRRNPMIARIFQHMSHVELNASGVRRMRLEMERVSLPFPKFIDDHHVNVVRVVLVRPSAWDDVELPPPSARPKPGQLCAMISSTGIDLPDHRRAAIDACLRLGVFPIAIEQLVARDSTAIQTSLEIVDRADIYIGIYAWRYGWVPDGSDISIIEMEFNRALERGIPILVCLMDEEHPVTRMMIESDPDAVAKLRTFRERRMKEGVYYLFKSPVELRTHISKALAEPGLVTHPRQRRKRVSDPRKGAGPGAPRTP